MNRNQLLLLAIGLGSLVSLAGCGGGGGTSNNVAAAPQMGSISFQVAWPNAREALPQAKLLIPFQTQSIRVVVTDPQTEQALVNSVLVTRSTNPVENVVINGIRAGAVHVDALAFANNPPGVSDSPLASGAADTTVSAGQTTTVDLNIFPFAPPPPPL